MNRAASTGRYERARAGGVVGRLLQAGALLCTALLAGGVAHAANAGTVAKAAGGLPRQAPAPEHVRYLVEQASALEHGEGVAQDFARAAELYCEAAKLGDPRALYALGWMYANGRGIARDDDHAGVLFALAAARGDSHAAQMLRFTGEGRGDGPDCLKPAVPPLIEPGWDIEDNIRHLPTERQQVARLVATLALDYQVRPRFALAVALTESALNPGAVSPKNAMGVMQLIPDTAARFNVKNPFDPAENIKGGLAYLRWLLAYFSGDVALAAAAYNAGERAVERYRGIPPYRETQDYVKRVLALAEHRIHPYDSTVVEPSEVMQAAVSAAPTRTAMPGKGGM